MNSKIVYVLTHEYPKGRKGKYTETKYLGMYSTYDKAEKLIDLYIDLPGFCNYGRKCFVIREYEIGKDYYKYGFAVKK